MLGNMEQLLCTQFSKLAQSGKEKSVANIYHHEVCVTYGANCVDDLSWCKDFRERQWSSLMDRSGVEDQPTECKIVIQKFTLLIFLKLWGEITLRSSLISNIFEI